MTSARAGVLAALPVVGLLALSAALPVRGQQTAPPPPAAGAPGTAAPTPPLPSFSPRLKEAAAMLKDGRHDEAARLLRTLDVRAMEPDAARRWRSLASLAALRTGDRAWIADLARDPERFSNTLVLITATAAQLLRDGELDQARALLSRVKDPENLDEIPRRRYLQLWARLEQLSGNPAAERVYVAKLVDFAGRWPSPTCQGCHANAKQYGEQTTTLNVAGWWVGERFSALLKASGDAARVRQAAQKRLARDPNDGSARLRVGFALRAEGRAAEAEAALRVLPWAEFPDREKRTPLRLATFP